MPTTTAEAGTGCRPDTIAFRRAAIDRVIATMREQLDSLELTWERIPAVDGTALPPEVLLQENRRARPRRLSAGEIGCLRSHVAVWQRIAEARAPAALVLEDDVLLAAGVHVPSGAHTHGIDDMSVPIRDQPSVKSAVRIGRGSWIGSAAVVMADVGRDTVVAAGAVVTQPIPDCTIAGGVPARVLRERHEGPRLALARRGLGGGG